MELTQDQRRELRKILESEEWRILRDRLERLSIKNEREKAGSLRVHNFNRSTYLQGIVDGIELTIDTIEKSVQTDKQEEASPIY